MIIKYLQFIKCFLKRSFRFIFKSIDPSYILETGQSVLRYKGYKPYVPQVCTSFFSYKNKLSILASES